MKSAETLRAERLALLDEAKALGEMAQAGDDLTDEQQERFEALTSDDGEIASATASLESAEKFEARVAAVEQQRKSDADKSPSWNLGPSKEAEGESPRIEVMGGRSKYFDDPREAKAASEWFAWASAPNRESREHHAAEMARFGGDAYNAQSIGTDGKGGYLVPTPIATEIIKNRDDVGVAAKVTNRVTMGQETLGFNEETGDATVYYPGESTAITASDVDWTRHTLAVTKRAALVKMSREFIADANVSAADQIINNLSYRFAFAMDNELINGDGTSTYGSEEGLIDQAAAGQTVAGAGNTFAELTLANYEAVVAAVPGKYFLGSPAWIMSRACWFGSVLPLANDAGGNTISLLQNGLGGLQWLGYPVYLTDLMPAEANSATAALFGAFSRGVTIGDRGDMSIDMSAERYFETDDVAIRATHRYDILVHNNATYAALELAAS